MRIRINLGQFSLNGINCIICENLPESFVKTLDTFLGGDGNLVPAPFLCLWHPQL